MLVAHPDGSTSGQQTIDAVRRFNDAFGRHDVDAVMAAMTDDCLFEDTSPPDGRRHVGPTEVRAAWTEFFAASPDATFETEDIAVTGPVAVVRWRYTWGGATPSPGHIRGIDVFTVCDGKVATKSSYVKG
jgi:ketosteroid isomerase-like protein